MTHELVIVYGDEFKQYDLAPGHPLDPVRVLLTYELMKHVGLLSAPGVFVEPPTMAPLEKVLLFHRDYYIDYVRRACAAGNVFLDSGDTPAFPGGLEASQYVVGGSLVGADVVMSGKIKHAFNIGGGLHHAHPHQASGFCILNDVAVAISHLKTHYKLERIAYLDVDAHHGDGVMYGFYKDGGVLDIDFHEDGRFLFPGTGRLTELGEDAGLGLKINIPLPPNTGDVSYLYAFRELVPQMVRRYHPEIILVQCGVDAHGGDPLTDLNLSNATYAEVVETMHDLAHELCDGRLLLFGGGGYNQGNVTRCWTMAGMMIAGLPLPDRTPDPWRAEFERLNGVPAPLTFREPRTGDNYLDKVKESVSFLKEKLLLA